MFTTAVAVEIHSTHEESHSDTYKWNVQKEKRSALSYVTGGVEIHFCKMADLFLNTLFCCKQCFRNILTKLFYL